MNNKANKTWMWATFLVWALIVLHNIARAEDWTVAGKDYTDVKVVHVYDDHVAVTYSTGMGNFKLADLSPELQARFSYDPAKANAAAKADEDARNKAIAELQANTPKPQVQATAPSPAPAPTPAPERLAQIASRIAALKEDIAQKQKIASHEAKAGHVGNGFKDILADEQRELAMLQSQQTALTSR